MGSQMVKFTFEPGENEQIDAVIKMPNEPRSVIHGVVKNHKDELIENAIVNLFEADNSKNPFSLTPISHTFTDECGQFIFGPLYSGKQYVIKIWVNDIKFKELVVNPDNNDIDSSNIRRYPIIEDDEY